MLQVKIVFFFGFLLYQSTAQRLSIINGQRASIKNFPYQLVYFSDGEFVGGASIISSQFALTAGMDFYFKKMNHHDDRF